MFVSDESMASQMERTVGAMAGEMHGATMASSSRTMTFSDRHSSAAHNHFGGHTQRDPFDDPFFKNNRF